MSLIHDKVTVIADDPAYDVGSDEWNAEHKFPGAGAGEVVFVDGSGHAATGSDFTFDAATKTLTVNAGAVTTTQILGQTDGLTIFANSDGGASTLFLGDDQSATLGNGSAYVWVFGNGDIQIATPSGSFNLFDASGAIPNTIAIDGYAVIPYTDNAHDLGGLTADLGADYRWRTGYFGTELRSPLFSVASGAGNSGITTTVTTASLVGKTITIQGGIITGFA